MFRHSQKISVIVSLVLVFLLLFALGFLTFWLPEVVDTVLDAPDVLGHRAEMTNVQRRLVLVDAYAMLVVAYVAVVLMFFLLRAVLRGAVFSKTAAVLLACISWCCFAEGLLFVPLTVYFQLALCVVVAACFAGLCMRVVKNVIEEATRIKTENDFTI